MPFEISHGGKSGEGFSIKPKTLVKSTSGKQQPVACSYKPPKPFIDRIAVNAIVPDLAEGRDMWATFWQVKNMPDVLADVRPKGSNKVSCRIKLPGIADTKKWPYFEVNFEQKCVTKLRIEFIPVDLGYDGLVDLHAVLTTLMPNGWLYFIEHGRISRLDVTVDLPGLKLDQLMFLPKQTSTTKEWSQSGKMTGFQIGKKNGNHIQIYDRGAKRKAKGQPHAGKEGVRVECRLRYLKLPIEDLSQLSCPFGRLTPVHAYCDCPPFEKKLYLWQFFLDSVSLRGLPAALKLLPEQKRTRYREFLKQNVIEQWDLEGIWSQWQQVLGELRIADLDTWN